MDSKSAYLLEANMKNLKFYVTNEMSLFMLTVTFEDGEGDVKILSKRLGRFQGNFLNRHKIKYIRVRHVHRSGSSHFHYVLVLPWNADPGHWIAENINIGYTERRQKHIRRNYVGKLLELDLAIEASLPRYGVGEVYLFEPVKCLPAVANYLLRGAGHAERNRPSGVRAWTMSKDLRSARHRIAWVGGRSKAFRDTARDYYAKKGVFSLEEALDIDGSRWGYRVIQMLQQEARN